MQSLPALLPLVGAKGRALFTKGDAAAAEQAVAAGYLVKREVAPPAAKGRKKAAVAYGVITESGARKAALGGGGDEIQSTLTDLQGSVVRLGALSTAAAEGVAAAIDSAAETCASALRSAVADLRAEVLAAVATATGSSSADPAPLLAAIRSALDRVVAEPTVIRVPVVADAPPAAPQVVGGDSLPDEVVAFVTAVARERSVGCGFVELYDHLRARHPGLTIGAFHDALRGLDDAGRVRLKDWPRMLDELPRPELALFVTHTVMYHVQPAQ
ncbi:hypothetical protein [Gemmata sp.]|uniref:hypothetical protein n=1 Tax=Gemmata sp. TaxID=1914242 RepID=UPI003F7095C8